MNRGHEVLGMVDSSFYDARFSGETVSVTFPSGNVGGSTQGRWKFYMTGCIGNVERIFR